MPIPPALAEPASLPTDDARFVTRLMLDARAVSDAYAPRADFILQGLIKRLDLKLALVGMVRIVPGRPAPELLHGRRVGTMSPDELRAMHSYYEDMNAVPDPALAASVGLLLRTPGALAARRIDLVTDDEWAASDNVRRCRLPGGVDDELLTGAPTGVPGEFIAMSLHRAIGAPPFTARDRDVAFFVQTSIDWLFADLAIEQEGERLIADLTPGRMAVLARLLAGDSAKQAASAVGSSVHAVNQQIKALHRHFKAASRGELLARCMALRLNAARVRAIAESPGRTTFPLDQDPEYRRRPRAAARAGANGRAKPAPRTAKARRR